MSGTNKLNFTILHDTNVHLTTGNGFSSKTIHGANNVLIDDRASFIFIEKSHQRIPMWAIFGSLTMKEDSELQIINSYSNTPSDNYNIHFKGTDCKINLYNPKNLTIYTKNANVIYTNNPLTSTNGFILENALVFKKFDDEVITLSNTPTVVFTGSNNEEIVSFKELNWSTEKGPLLDLTNDALEINEEYFSTIYFNIEE